MGNVLGIKQICSGRSSPEAECHQEETTKLCSNPELIMYPNLIHKNFSGIVHFGELDFKSVAVITIKKSKEKDAERETRILSNLEHKNILRIFFKYRKDETLYVVTELYDNSLEYYMKYLTDYKDIVVQILEAISYIQSLQIMHLNLAPENIFIVITEHKLIVKLAGFTCATLPSGTSSTKKFQLGNRNFAAPEIYSKKIAYMTSDVYSMGSIFFYLFSEGMNIRDMTTRNRKTILAARKSVKTYNDIICAELIYRTTFYKNNERLSIKQAKKYPLTWDHEKIRNFIVDIYKLSETADDTFRKILYDRSYLIIGKDENWKARIEDEILIDLQGSFVSYISRMKPNKAKATKETKLTGKINIMSLIKTMRGIIVHAPSPLIEQVMGTPEKFVEYWMTKFPGLLLHLYNAKLQFDVIKNNDDF